MYDKGNVFVDIAAKPWSDFNAIALYAKTSELIVSKQLDPAAFTILVEATNGLNQYQITKATTHNKGTVSRAFSGLQKHGLLDIVFGAGGRRPQYGICPQEFRIQPPPRDPNAYV
jgi:hypothetical protein